MQAIHTHSSGTHGPHDLRWTFEIGFESFDVWAPTQHAARKAADALRPNGYGIWSFARPCVSRLVDYKPAN